MKVLGCDCSTKKISLFLITSNGPLITEVTCEEKDYNLRINTMFKVLINIISDWAPDMVYAENAPYLQNIKVTLSIHSAVDAVRFACVLNNIPFQTVEVTSWKKSVLGNGRADKSQIMTWAKAKYREDSIKNQDIADSAGIATYGWMRMVDEKK